MPVLRLLAQDSGELRLDRLLPRRVHRRLPPDLPVLLSPLLVDPALSVLPRAHFHLTQDRAEDVLQPPPLPVGPLPLAPRSAVRELDHQTLGPPRVLGLWKFLLDGHGVRQVQLALAPGEGVARAAVPVSPAAVVPIYRVLAYRVATLHRLRAQALKQAQSPAPKSRWHGEAALVFLESGHHWVKGAQLGGHSDGRRTLRALALRVVVRPVFEGDPKVAVPQAELLDALPRRREIVPLRIVDGPPVLGFRRLVRLRDDHSPLGHEPFDQLRRPGTPRPGHSPLRVRHRRRLLGSLLGHGGVPRVLRVVTMLQIEAPGLGDLGPHRPATAYDGQQPSVAQRVRGKPLSRHRAQLLTAIQPPQKR